MNNLTETMGLSHSQEIGFIMGWILHLSNKANPQKQLNKYTELVSVIMTVHKWNKFLPIAVTTTEPKS